MFAKQSMTISDALRIFSEKPPVDVEGMADALGLGIMRESLGPNISGKIEKASVFSNHTYLITVNREHSPTRQRFTIAHEIAHYILHRDKIGDGITDDGLYRSNRSDEIEWEANAFAATILMPGGLVQSAFRAGNRSVAGISKLFDVSYAVAEIRMKDLRL